MTIINCLPLLTLYYFCTATTIGLPDAASREFFTQLHIASDNLPIASIDLGTILIPFTPNLVIKVLLIAPFLVVAALFWYLTRDLDRIQRMLEPQLEHCDPDALVNSALELPAPGYLKHDSGVSKHGLNKHELLFGRAKSSHTWYTFLLQVVYLILVIASAWALVTLWSDLAHVVGMSVDTADSAAVPEHLLLPLLYTGLLYMAAHLLARSVPRTLAMYTVCTSTEMMKDREVVNEVIGAQKQAKD